MELNKRDKIVLILFVLFLILALAFLFYARSEGTKCLRSPLEYSYSLLKAENKVCYCIADGTEIRVGNGYLEPIVDSFNSLKT